MFELKEIITSVAVGIQRTYIFAGLPLSIGAQRKPYKVDEFRKVQENSRVLQFTG